MIGLHGGGVHSTAHLPSLHALSASSFFFDSPMQVAGLTAPVRQSRHFASPLQAAISGQHEPSMHEPHGVMLKTPEQSGGGPPVLLEALPVELPVELPPPAPPPPAPLPLEALALEALALEALLEALLLTALLLAELEPVPMLGAKQAPIDGAVTGASHAAMLLLTTPVPVDDPVDVVVVVVVVLDPVVGDPVVVVVVSPPAPVEPPAPIDVVPVPLLEHASGTRGTIAAATRIQE